MITIEEQSQYDSINSFLTFLRAILNRKSEGIEDASIAIDSEYSYKFEFCNLCHRSLQRCEEELCIDRDYNDDWDRADELYDDYKDRKLEGR